MRYLITLMIALSIYGVVYVADHPWTIFIILISLLVTTLNECFDRMKK